MIPLLICAFLFFSCEKEPARIMHLDRADEELAGIAEDARNTLHSFFRHMNRPNVGESGFCVKYPFTVDDGSGITAEQVWLSDIHFKNGAYYGTLCSSPRHLNGMKKGGKVVFEVDNITDWMFVRNGKIIGGYSIQYLLERVPEQQRSGSEQKLLEMFY